MYLEQLSLTDFRSYAQVDVSFAPGITVLVGPNGTGKTNLVEAVGYLATLGSHRVSSDAPLLRFGTDRAVLRARLVRGTGSSTLELEINAGRANRARINRANPVRARDILGICRTVFFAPEDLGLVKGDPGGRRRFLDELLVTLLPHHAATASDYERVLKQRNALLKSARPQLFSRTGVSASHLATLDVWDQHMAAAGARLLAARLNLVEQLLPHLQRAYADLTDGSKILSMRYLSSLDMDGEADGEPGTPVPLGEPVPLVRAGVEDLTRRY
ncbi:MAG TPA: DNA replication and repair protein RecF, partial [Micrococcaceae bacterium]|nr:DNA replication and repair protein RecF [Micrococcaceae bacterium]